MAYVNFTNDSDSKRQSDILVGDNMGNIGIVTSGKYFRLYEKAHKTAEGKFAMVNRILITNSLSDKPLIITSGEDETVRIWDMSLNPISTF